jgi:hypothetical protein
MRTPASATADAKGVKNAPAVRNAHAPKNAPANAPRKPSQKKKTPPEKSGVFLSKAEWVGRSENFSLFII